jgi:hypothetical protein
VDDGKVGCRSDGGGRRRGQAHNDDDELKVIAALLRPPPCPRAASGAELHGTEELAWREAQGPLPPPSERPRGRRSSPGEEDVAEGPELNCSAMCDADEEDHIDGSHLLLRHETLLFFSS